MTEKDKSQSTTDEASFIDDWGSILEAYNMGLSLGDIRKNLSVNTSNKGAQRVNNKPWDVTPERLAELIEACQTEKTCRPGTQIEALEFGLAKWHPSRGHDRGDGLCGCCRWILRQGVYGCGDCPLKSNSGCCDGYWLRWLGAEADWAAEAVYQFILGKYWEEKERVQDE